MFKSAKAWFEAANGQQVTREVIEGRHAGTWEQEKAQAKIDAEKRGYLLVSEDDQEITFALGSQSASLRRSKMAQKVTGLFIVRSSDYFLMVEGTPQYGEKKGAEIDGDSMIKTYSWGKCRFTIGESV
jgi:hypothetical protein